MAFHFTLLQTSKAVGQREEENMIYLFPFISFFSKYATLTIGDILSVPFFFSLFCPWTRRVHFIPVITQCSKALAQPGPINTYAV